MQISFVKIKELSQGIRLDAEYYKPIFLEIENLLRRIDCKRLEDVSSSIKSFGAYALCNQMIFADKGIPFLRCKDIKEGFVDFSEVLFIDEATNHLLSKSSILSPTVLLTMSGTVGNSAIAFPEWNYPLNSNQDIAKIETNEKINPYYLTVFLNGKYGKRQTERLPVGSIQQHIFIWQLKNLLVFLPSKSFQTTIEKIYITTIKFLKDSETLYQQAEQILLSELGLLNWKPRHCLSFVKNYSDAQSAGRLDAEYFHPKYEDILDKIIKYGSKPIGQLFKQNRTPFKIIQDIEYRYVEIGSVNNVSGEIDPLIVRGGALPPNAKIKLNINDVIISKVRTYRGAVSIIQENNLVGSSAFTALKETGEINRETLFAFFKSKPILALSLKYNAGHSWPK